MIPDEDERTAELLAEWAEQRRSDGAVPAEELLRRHPERAEALRAGIEVIRSLDPSVPAAQDRPDEPESVLAPLHAEGLTPGPPVLLPEDAGELPPVIVPRPGAEGRYRIVGEIARGGIGVVLRGHDVDLGRDVAMKVLREEHAERADVLQRFVEEAQIGGQLQHPGIVPVYDVGLGKDRRPYFTMKLIKGQTLAALLSERRKVADDRRRFVTIFESVCQTVAYAHARSVIHRDLKPSNVMVGAFGEVLVVDWGLAKVLRRGGVADEKRAEPRAEHTVISTHRSAGSGSLAGSVMGTPSFMSPEQARGEVDTIDERADVFALGAILCEILTGTPPYVGTREEVYRQALAGRVEATNARLAAGGVDAELVALTQDCLAEDPRHRPRDAAAVARRVAVYLALLDEKRRTAEAEAARATLRAAEERKRRRLSVALAAATLALVVLGGGGLYWMDTKQREREGTVTREVADALEEASVLHARAVAAPSERPLWQQALAAVRRAEAVARSPDADGATRERVAGALASLEGQSQAAERATQEAEANRRLVERLEEARQSSAEHFSGKRRDLEVAAVLKDHGIDPLGASEPRALGERIHASPVRLAIVLALDEWRRNQVRREESTERLDLVLASADPDPWRTRLRSATSLDDLRKLAAQADPEVVPLESLLLLVVRFGELGDATAAADLARRVQARHPGDFWANFFASRWAKNCVPPRDGDAMRFATAALALRPHSYWPHHVLGDWLVEAGEIAAGVAACREAVRLRPDRPDVQHGLGVALRRAGDLDGAIAANLEAIRLDPGMTEAHYNLGCLLSMKKDSDGAVAAFRAALKLDAAYWQAYCNLGNELMRKGDFDGAVAAHREGIRLERGQQNSWLCLGDALKAQGNVDAAIEAFREAILLKPESAAGHLGLGLMLTRKGKTAEAIAAYREALRLKPDHAEALNNLGILLRRAGDVEGAIATLEQLIRVKPDHVGARSNLGIALAQKGEAEAAIAAYREEIRLNPTFQSAYINLAASLRGKRDFDGALASCREAIRLQPDAAAHYALALTLAESGDPEGALAAYRETLRINPDHADAHNNLGILLKEKGDLPGAIVEYREALRHRPSDLAANYNLGVALGLQGDLEGAAAAFREAARLAPGDHDVRIELGATLRKSGDLDGALRELREAVRLNPRVADAHYELGHVLLGQGELDAAVAAYQEVLRLKPKFPDAEELRKALDEALRAAGRGSEAAALLRNPAETPAR
jgi:serine/threonine-protein kinase